MNRGRQGAFSDGVVAILITTLVLELRVPSGTTLAALRPLLPQCPTHILSFVRLQGEGSELAAVIGKDLKGKISPFFYAIAIPLAFVDRWISYGLYIFVALMRLVPDRRIESKLYR